jgi:hypothetical protein
MIQLVMLNTMYLLTDYQSLMDNKLEWYDWERKDVPFLVKFIVNSLH